MLLNAIAFMNGKGGVGKTSACANVAGIFAERGSRVLAIDFDSQGNLGLDLGYKQRGDSDGGQSLLVAFIGGEPLRPLQGVRPNLDVVPGGEHTDDLARLLAGGRYKDQLAEHFLRVLQPVASSYDIILADCPPKEQVLQEGILSAVGNLVVPMKADRGSVEALELVAKRFTAARTTNPYLQLIGVFLFSVSSAGVALRREWEQDVRRLLGDDPPIFAAAIRSAERAAKDMRDEGQLAFEYHKLAEEDRRKLWQWIRSGKRNARAARSSASGGLVQDYIRLTDELLDHYEAAAERLQTALAPGGVS